MLCNEIFFDGDDQDDANEIEMVTTLRVPFEVSGPPADADSDQYKDYFVQGELHLVGTCHAGYSSAELVRETIARVRPDVVFIELDEQRRSRLQVVLGDRKLTTTLKRCTIALIRSPSVLYLMAWLGFLMFGWLLIPLAGAFEETVGRKIYTRKSRIEEDRKKFRESCPAFARALMDERDLFMTFILHKIFEIQSRVKFTYVFFTDDAEPLRVVAVVGAMHVPGIASLFGKPIDREVLEELCQ